MRQRLVVVTAAAVLAVAGSAEAQIDRPVTASEIQELRRQIHGDARATLEVLIGAHGETGDLNNRLGFVRYGGRFDLKLGSGGTASLTATQTDYSTRERVLEATGTRVALGYRSPASDKTEHRFELGLTRFSTETTTLDGLASLSLRPIPAARLTLTAARAGVEESLLSVAGLRPTAGPFVGELVGRVMENRIALAADWRLPYRLDLFGDVALGNRQGPRVDVNAFKRIVAGIGFNAVTAEAHRRVSLLRGSASVFHLAFDENRLGYGGASLVDHTGARIPLEALGSDEIPPVPSPGNPGVGGYFSPDRFTSVVARVDVGGRLASAVDYKAYGFVGTQSYTDRPSRAAMGVSGQLTLRLGDRLSAPVSFNWENFGPFAQRYLFLGLVVRL